MRLNLPARRRPSENELPDTHVAANVHISVSEIIAEVLATASFATWGWLFLWSGVLDM